MSVKTKVVWQEPRPTKVVMEVISYTTHLEYLQTQPVEVARDTEASTITGTRYWVNTNAAKEYLNYVRQYSPGPLFAEIVD